MSDKNFKKILKIALLSRVLILVCSFLYVIFCKDFPVSIAKFLTHFGERWDGNSYRFIVENGYLKSGTPGSEFIVFMPFYPLVVKMIVSATLLETALIQCLISNILFVLGCGLFYKVLRSDYSEKNSKRVINIFIWFPTSYFFSSGYPESLFLFTTMLAIRYSQKNKTTASSLFTGLTSITRPTGIFTAILVFANSYKRKNKIGTIIISVLIFAAFPLSYLLINKYVNNDWLSFQKVLNENWQKSLSPPWKGIKTSFTMFFNYTQWTYYDRFMVGLFEGIATLFAWVLPFVCLVKRCKLKISYYVYYFLSLILSTSTGFILSSPRYLLSIFPFFIMFNFLLKNKFAYAIWMSISIAFLAFFTANFSSGMWAF